MTTHEEIFKKIESTFGNDIYLSGINIQDNNDLSIKIEDEFSKNKNDRISVIVLGKGNYIKCDKTKLIKCNTELKICNTKLDFRNNELIKCNEEKNILYIILIILFIYAFFLTLYAIYLKFKK